MVFKWNDETTLLFLENFKKYQCLWNHKLDEYKDRTIRANSMKSLISDLNLEVTEEDIKHKIKTIRTRYTTEITKIKNSTKSGCSSDDVYVPTLYWFKHANFLSGVCVPRQSTSNLDTKTNTQKETQMTENENSAESEQSHSAGGEEQMTPNREGNGNSGSFTPNCSAKPINRKRKIDMPIDRAIKELKVLSEENKKQTDDEFDLFCKSLAVQLKNMPLNRALLCQEKLQSVMTRERLAQIVPPLPETIYSDSSTQSPFSTYASPRYESTIPQNYYVTQQVYSPTVSIPPQEINQTALNETSTQENILSRALQSIID